MARKRSSGAVTTAQERFIEQEVEKRLRRAFEQILPDVADRPGDEGFRRITQTEKDLAPPAHDRHLRIAYYLYVTNPMAHRIIDMTRDFVIGDGAQYSAKDERVKAVLDKHWNDPVNHWDIKQFAKVKELFLYGEQIYPVFVNEFTGHVRLGYIDPLNVEQVLPDPGNPEVLKSVVLKTGKEVVVRERNPETNRLVAVPKKELRVINVDGNPRSPTYGRLVGDCFYFAMNKASNATRGFSELMHLSDWIDAYDQLLFTHMERLMFLRTFVWDILLEGADEQAIKLRRKNLSLNPPKPGSWIVHNEKEKWTAVTPDLKATEHTEEERKVRALILGGAGIPPHWFGEGEDVNRATALAMDTPVFRMLKARQRYVRFMVEHIFRFCVDQAIIKRVLPAGDETLSTDLAVTLPEFSARDEGQVARTLTDLVNAMTVARSQNWVSDETAARLIAMIASKLGVEIDPDEEMAKALAVPANTEAFKVAIEKIIARGGHDGSPAGVSDQAQGA
ncbi:MAG: hypothetical protein HY600_05575 [Candidatus Omnitrophica bacterium]|nr:hypothetical protein [Candidatus Omnitrophota bacterium]